MEAMNVRLFNLTHNIWNRLEEQNPELAERSMQYNNRQTKDHFWWPRIAPIIARGEPAPNY